MNRLKNKFSKESILIISGILAFISCFFVFPDKKYIDYINFRTLVLLFCLMAVTAGLKKAGAFDYVSHQLISSASHARRAVTLLTIFSFLLSMFVTNDVALVTMVPLTLIVLNSVSESTIIISLVEETIAANLGSMLTPFGNPQNLFLSSTYNISFVDFIKLTALYTILSFIIIMLQMFLIKNEPLRSLDKESSLSDLINIDLKSIIIYSVLFIIAILSILRILNYWILLCIILLFFTVYDFKLLKEVNYSLLLTFLFFFILIGNLGRIDAIYEILKKMIEGREVITSILCSQVMSNVPCAILLSGFTDKGTELIIGTNLGGLGTLIASMASVITFQLYIKKKGARPLRYIAVFTILNLVDLAILLALFFIIR